MVPMTVFAKDGHHAIEHLENSGLETVGLDWSIDPIMARKLVGDKVTLLWNFDPPTLYSSVGDSQGFEEHGPRPPRGLRGSRPQAFLGEEIVGDDGENQILTYDILSCSIFCSIFVGSFYFNLIVSSTQPICSRCQGPHSSTYKDVKPKPARVRLSQQNGSPGRPGSTLSRFPETSPGSRSG